MTAESNLTLYHAPMTRSVRVRWCLEQMGLPYVLERVSFDRGNVGGDAYRAVNPMQKVPAFKDGDTVVLESTAIVEYLVTRHGPTELAVSPDEPEYGRYLEFLHFGEATMSMGVNLTLAHGYLLPEDQRNPSVLKWARAAVDKQLGLIAERGLENGARDWIAAGRLTAADMSVGYMLYLLKIVRQFDGAPPVVQAYFDRIKALPSWQAASRD